MTTTPSAREPQAIASLRAYLHNGGHHSGAPTPTALSLALDQLDGNLREVLAAYDALAAEREALVKWKADTEEHARLMLGFGASYDGEPLWAVMGGCNQNYSYEKGRADSAERERDALRAELQRLRDEDYERQTGMMPDAARALDQEARG